MDTLNNGVGWWQRMVRAVGYLAIGAAGVWVFWNPPTALGFALGWTLGVVWGVFMLAALPAAIAAALGLYKIEFAALPWFIGGLLVSSVHLWWGVAHEHPEQVARSLLITALVLLCTARFLGIRELVKVRPRGRQWWIHSK